MIVCLCRCYCKIYALKGEEIFSVSMKGMLISGERVFIQKMNQETSLKLENKNMAYEKDVTSAVGYRNHFSDKRVVVIKIGSRTTAPEENCSQP